MLQQPAIFTSFREVRARRGFTLIEILVSITIILILAGVLIAVASNVRSKALISHTKVTLTALQAVMDDYLRDNPPLDPPLPALQPFNNTDGTLTPSWISALKNFPQFRAPIEKIQSESLSGTNIAGVIDAWRHPIRYVDLAPGSSRPGFISAGPDGQFGTPDDLSSGEK